MAILNATSARSAAMILDGAPDAKEQPIPVSQFGAGPSMPGRGEAIKQRSEEALGKRVGTRALTLTRESKRSGASGSSV